MYAESSKWKMDRKDYKTRLKEYPMDYRFKIPMIRECISQSIDTQRDWHPSDAAKAYSCLETIVRNLLSNPYRKMYHEIRTYSGTFKHVLSRLPLIDDILKLIGYDRREGYFKLSKSALSSISDGRSNLANILDDLILAGLLCEIMDDMYGTESEENLRLMCKIRLDPAYFEHEEAGSVNSTGSQAAAASAASASSNYFNGVPERHTSQSKGVTFLENEVASSYPMTKPSKARSSKTTTEIAWSESTLARPRPRSILRSSLPPGVAPPSSAAVASTSAAARAELDGSRRFALPESSYTSPKETKRKSPEAKTSAGRYLPSPPTHTHSHAHTHTHANAGYYGRPLPSLVNDFHDGPDLHVPVPHMRYKTSSVPVDGLNQPPYPSLPLYMADDSEVRVRSRHERAPSSQTSVSHRYSSNEPTSRRHRQQTLSYRSSTGGAYKR